MKAEPMHVVLTRLLSEAEITPYALSRRCKALGWGSPQTINETVRGNLVPGLEGMAVIATALEVEPEVFAEYRLAKRRHELDWRAVGLDAAVEALED